MKHKVLLVDDDTYVIGLLRTAFASEEFDISVAGTGRDALSAVDTRLPDLIVLDVGLPDLLGTEVARRLRANGISTPILMLTAMDSEQHIVAGLESGATAYVTKPVRPSEIRAWARALLRDDVPPQRTRVYGGIELDAERRCLRVRATGQEIKLTSLQVRLLAVLMDAAGEPLSRHELLRRVWDMDFDPGTPLVEVHISALRRKLAVLGDAIQLETIRNVGYQLKSYSLKNS
jgi:DNA-binding response OmpR family regulator